MILLNGQKLADGILDDLKKEIKTRQLKLKLAVVLVGQDPSSKIYIKKKEEAARKIGLDFGLHHFKENIKQKELGKEVAKIGKDKKNSGMIIQLPLPGSMDAKKILDLIPAQKDVDVLSEKNFEKFSAGKLKILPPTIGAIAAILKEYRISLKGRYVVIVGAGRLVGKPLAAWLRLQKANFSILDKNTEDLSYFTKKADILISGVGRADLIRGDMVRQGSTVIDVGGDVNFSDVSGKTSCITPVFGGVGPLTVAYLLYNLVKINE